MEKPKPQRNTPVDSDEARRTAEEGLRVPGTANFRLLEDGGGPVGRQAIEAESILGHDNLEAKTEIEKDSDDQARNPSASGSFRIHPNKLD